DPARPGDPLRGDQDAPAHAPVSRPDHDAAEHPRAVVDHKVLDVARVAVDGFHLIAPDQARAPEIWIAGKPQALASRAPGRPPGRVVGPHSRPPQESADRPVVGQRVALAGESYRSLADGLVALHVRALPDLLAALRDDKLATGPLRLADRRG